MLTVLLFAFFFSFSSAPLRMHTFISLFLPLWLCSILSRNTCIFPDFLPCSTTPALAHTYTITLFFFFFFPCWRPPCSLFPPPPSSYSFCASLTCCSFWLVSKHHPLPGHRQQHSLFAIQIFFLFFFSRKIVNWCVPSQHKSPCKFLYTRRTALGELFTKKRVIYYPLKKALYKLLCSGSSYLHYSLPEEEEAFK